MTRDDVHPAVVSAKLATIEEMLDGIGSLPLDDHQRFREDRLMVAAGESFLRRALEALLDLGRHLLAKGFGRGATEYKQIPTGLREVGVLSSDLASKLTQMAGYRNRLVHFYDDVTADELYAIFTEQLEDVREVRDALIAWLGGPTT